MTRISSALAVFVVCGFELALAATTPSIAADVVAPASGDQMTAAPDTFVAPAKPARKPYDFLMFATDEFNDIRGRLNNGGETDTGAGDRGIENARLYLSTIVYYGPKDWTIWVNGIPIGPDQEFQSFQVTEINANSVQLLVPLSAQGMRPIRLSPNQTFVTKTGAVVEGKIQ